MKKIIVIFAAMFLSACGDGFECYDVPIKGSTETAQVCERPANSK
jgi:hypothetical protein